MASIGTTLLPDGRSKCRWIGCVSTKTRITSTTAAIQTIGLRQTTLISIRKPIQTPTLRCGATHAKMAAILRNGRRTASTRRGVIPKPIAPDQAILIVCVKSLQLSSLMQLHQVSATTRRSPILFPILVLQDPHPQSLQRIK